MCGLVAIVRAGGLTDDERGATLDGMRDAIAHRGPDDATRAIVDDWVGLGHRRLSIIDVAGSRQPLGNETGDVVCVFNGEIYNFAELRRRLQALGHQFATRGDGEVIVHGYEQWGDAMAARLEGMFAFVLVDRRRRRVVAARDRFGIKPLFWTQRGGAVLFGSELKALLVHPSVPRVASRLGLDLGMMRAHVPWPLTAFDGVYRLPPGSLLAVDGAGEPALHRFAPMNELPSRPCASEDLLAATRYELGRAVARQMVADVPVGAFLSGGIDSTLIVTLMRQLTGEPIHTFSVATGSGDEAAAARQTAQRLGTTHHEIDLGTLPFADLALLATLFDEPFAETSALGVRALSLAAKKHVTVVLTGDGGDEVFGGYDTYRYIRNVARVGDLLPTRLAAPVRDLATWQLRDRAWPTAIRRGLRALSILGASPRLAQRWLARQEPQVVAQTLVDSARLTARIERAATDARDHDALGPARQAMLADRLERLPGAMLTKVDVASMSASLEVRVPLLDDALVRFAGGIDENELVGPLRGKRILRRVLARLLPGRLSSAPKRGFTIPIERWLRTRDTQHRLRELFAGEARRLVRLTGCDAVDRLDTFVAAGPARPSPVTADELLWLANVALWAQRFDVHDAVRNDPLATPLA